MKQMIDPEAGWKYGFPKELPDDIDNDDILEWLWENGYPKGKEPLYCRYWNVDG